ncbi:hypothetical protein J2M53_04675 [Arthrobacter sp. zg-ZUI100]|uniref:Uncharacterized protein n=1 Tax=Arthrobacter jiangjiafuii TaxID=2817475 RepID=A0A975M4S8_9MICC|nr:hypothetical protein [Arthrobacter jiangjiafuii]MBP3035551.1 hypothetical protein [Arthrobacter jiangjiafuii]MBP3042251.1 hypothetical protein [Arthrobacter jiangjiafuii]QWC09983.1 hypothetical protein KKR91_16295 [Arthrobacter jiangjiafuii]
MASRDEVVVAASSRDLSEVLGCSEDVVEDLRDMGIVESRGELWNVGPARDYLRDAAWAGGFWH